MSVEFRSKMACVPHLVSRQPLASSLSNPECLEELRFENAGDTASAFCACYRREGLGRR